METNFFKTNLSENEQRSVITGGKLHDVTNRGIKCGVGLEQWSSAFLHLLTPWQPVSINSEGKSVPLQAWSGPEGSRKLRFPDYVTIAQDGGKVVSLTYRPLLPLGNTPGTHFC